MAIAGLSLAQKFFIGGGRAADIVRASDVQKSKEYNDAFNKFIDNNVGAIKKASAKRLLLENKMKKDISQIVNTYLVGRDNLSESAKFEIANTIYASHGYSMDNVNKDVKSRKQNYLISNPLKGAADFDYVDAYITNTKDIKSDRTLDQIAKKNAQELVPQPTLDLAAKAKGLGRYKETAFFSPDTDKIESDLLAATGYKEDEVIAEGPTITTSPPPANEMELLRARNLRSSIDNTLLRKQDLEKKLETGIFSSKDIEKLYNFQLGLAYNAQGLKIGQDADGAISADEFGPRTENAQKDSFQYVVERILKAKPPVQGKPYINSNQVRLDLARIGKNIPIIKIDGQNIKDADRIVGRVYESETGKQYIYLGENIDDIVLSK